MTSSFVIPSLANLNADLAQRHYPLDRGQELHRAFAQCFSRHLGRLRSEQAFEARSLLVTGLSGSGKSKEILHLLDLFWKEAVELPCGKPARFVRCVLDAKGSWKDLGRKTLHALGYPISNKTRRTQFEIWEMVMTQASLQGVVGIHYDEAQHIMRGKSDADVMTVLDAFKTLMKSSDWPLMLILSGVPELGDYVQREPQLDRLMTRVAFSEIATGETEAEIARDYEIMNDIVGSYALKVDLPVAPDLQTGAFLHRLATGASFRWGLLIEIVIDAIGCAVSRGADALEVEDFVTAWCEKTGSNQLVTPFTHDAYERVFRRDRPFRASLTA
ncbi:ATP-binding protein [Donghicola eburneus]|uniref:ATP-binding protein n=1 Tax=Donghicola eburneus TaxID=393278 RepID=UPI000AB8D977|nr:ATP-binding protein [Donghicola eburneus]